MNLTLFMVISIILVGIVSISTVQAQNFEIPVWIKNNAGWWSTDQIDDSSFLKGIEYLINKEIMIIPSIETSGSPGSQLIPPWIKNNAGWWAEGQIDDNSFVGGIQWLISNGIIVVEENTIHEYQELLVAFIGDQGGSTYLSSDLDVLNLIKNEKAQLVVHQGDLGFEHDNPDEWDEKISSTLGKDFPYIASQGHHDKPWNQYQIKLQERLNSDLICNGNLGIKSTCTYHNLLFTVIAPGEYTDDSDYDSFVQEQLRDNDSYWKICSMHNDMYSMQAEAKLNKTGMEVFEACRNGGAIVATGHQHFYARSGNIIEFVEPNNQRIDLEWSESNKLRVKEGSTFTFISGLGGSPVTNQAYYEWPVNYATEQNAAHGALFCIFNAGGQPNKAYCYFKDVDGAIVDSFTITSFLGRHYDDIDFVDVNLSGKDLSGENMSNKIITDSNLSNTILAHTDLSNSVLIGTKLTGADLTNANLTNVNLAYKDLTGTILRGANLLGGSLAGVDLTGQDLTGTILRATDLSNADLTDVNLSGKDLTGAILKNVDLTGQDLTGTILRGANLSNADLSGQDLSHHNLTDVILTGTDLSNSVLPDNGLSKKNFQKTIFNGVDLSGKDLSKSNFDFASFVNTDMENTNLQEATFLNVDFTKIKNKSLAGTNMFGTTFAHSNLSGVNLDGINFRHTNFQLADLTDQDFTDTTITGSDFLDAKLLNANFEGVDLGHEEDNLTLKNKAHLVREYSSSPNKVGQIILDLMAPPPSTQNYIFLFAIQVRGDDIFVNYALFNNFSKANMEGANFKNANIQRGVFTYANLTNANFAGADLTNSDLRDANLEGANLTGAILDGATLSCKNHAICVPDT